MDTNNTSKEMDISDFVRELNSVINTNQETKPLEQTQKNEIVQPSTHKTTKILIVSTHINQANGYSKVIHNIINQLASHNWIKVVHFGTQRITNGEIGRKYPSNVKVIDGTAMEKQKAAGFGFSELPGVIMSEKPDVVFIYNDISVICAYIEEIRKAIQNRFFKIWSYIDMTYEHLPLNMLDTINRDVERIFCFSKFWKEQIKSQGLTRPVDVMNHAVDNKIFKYIPRDLARQNLGLPKDAFMITSVNRNMPRKRLDLLVMAFVKLIVRFPMKPIFLLIVGDKGDRGGFPLFEIFSRELKLANSNAEMFGNRLLITSSNTCYKDDDINLLYNCGDIGVSCAEGEGFGLCTFEQMSIGIPQIVPNINGYTEYCNEDNSIMVQPKFRYYIPQAYNTVTGEAKAVDIDDMAKAIETYVFDEDLRKLHGKRGKEKISEYTWEKCCAILVKRLKALQEDDD
jgi:glycosyltransferase involved in cell wall biosynthesis